MVTARLNQLPNWLFHFSVPARPGLVRAGAQFCREDRTYSAVLERFRCGRKEYSKMSLNICTAGAIGTMPIRVCHIQRLTRNLAPITDIELFPTDIGRIRS
jgi:hypothetical protein